MPRAAPTLACALPRACRLRRSAENLLRPLASSYEQFGVDVRRESRASREVITLESVRRKHPARDVTARAAAAVDVHGNAAGDIIQLLPQFVDGDIDRA